MGALPSKTRTLMDFKGSGARAKPSKTGFLRRTNRRRLASTQLASPLGTKHRLWAGELIRMPLNWWDWETRWQAENKRLGCIVQLRTDLRNLKVVLKDTLLTKHVL